MSQEGDKMYFSPYIEMLQTAQKCTSLITTLEKQLPGNIQNKNKQNFKKEHVII